MAVIEIRIEGQQALLAAWRRAPAAVEREMSRALQRGALETARAVRAEAPKATSQLTNSVTVSQPSSLVWQIAPTAEYAPFVEEGVRPGGRLPPWQALADWVRTRLQIADLDERRVIGWAIARKIQARGLPAQPFVRPVYEDPAWQARIQALVNAGARRAVARAGLS